MATTWLNSGRGDQYHRSRQPLCCATPIWSRSLRIPEPLSRSRYSSLHLPSHHMSYPDDNGTSWTSVNQRPKQAPSTESGNLFSAMLLTALYSYTTPANLPATTRTPLSASPPTGARPGLPRIQFPEPESSLATA